MVGENILMTDFLHINDLPDRLIFNGDIAVDCEAMGLNQLRDRLCVVQLTDGLGDVHLVHFPDGNFGQAHNLRDLLSDNSRTKILHFARFDVALIQHYLGVVMQPIYCTRTASRLIRTYTDKHGLKDLCRELLGVDLSKQQQSSYWGATELTPEQISYAASDVIYLHRLRDLLQQRLSKEGRDGLAWQVMQAIIARAWLDITGFAEVDIFAHNG
jgi:ribonuclease D